MSDENSKKVEMTKLKKQLREKGIKFDDNASLEQLQAQLEEGTPSFSSQEDLMKAVQMAMEAYDKKKAAEDAKRAEETAATIAALKGEIAELKAKKAAAATTGDTGLAEAITLAIKGKTDELGNVRSEYVDESDMIPIQRFFTPYTRYYLTHKEVGNQRVGLPLPGMKWLRFEEAFSYMDNAHGVNRRKCISTYDVQSNELYKWITGKDYKTGETVGTPCIQWNTEIFLDIDQALDPSFNTAWTTIYTRHLGGLQGKRHGELMGLASQYGIPTNAKLSTQELAAQVARVITDQEFAAVENSVATRRRQEEADTALLRKEGVQLMQ